MKGFKDTTRVQYFKGGQVTREKACGGVVKKAEGGRVTDPVKNKTGGKNDPEYGDYAISVLVPRPMRRRLCARRRPLRRCATPPEPRCFRPNVAP
jgi:hypothetical protein